MPDFVQMQNPSTGMWVKVDRKSGGVIAERKVRFLNVPVTSRDSEGYEAPLPMSRRSESVDPLARVRR